MNDGEAKVNAIRVYTNSGTNVPFPPPPTSYFVDAGASVSRVAADGVNYTSDSNFSNGGQFQPAIVRHFLVSSLGDVRLHRIGPNPRMSVLTCYSPTFVSARFR